MRQRTFLWHIAAKVKKLGGVSVLTPVSKEFVDE
jgi:hypothetical protein